MFRETAPRQRSPRIQAPEAGRRKDFLALPIECRPRREEDEAFLFALFCELRAPDFAAAGLPETMLDGLLRMQFTAQRNSYRTQHPAAEDQIVWSGNERLGRVLVDRNLESVHLVDLDLLARWRGQGIGTVLLSRLIEEARGNRIPLRLSVRGESPAIRLYERLGFRVTRDTGMDLLMEYTSSPMPDGLSS